MPEGDGELGGGAEPVIGCSPYEVLGREGFEDGHREGEGMLIVGELAGQKEILVMENHFAISVLDEHPEGFAGRMQLLVPLEVPCYAQLDFQRRPADGQDLRFEFHARYLMHHPMYRLPYTRQFILLFVHIPFLDIPGLPLPPAYIQ